MAMFESFVNRKFFVVFTDLSHEIRKLKSSNLSINSFYVSFSCAVLQSSNAMLCSKDFASSTNVHGIITHGIIIRAISKRYQIGTYE